MILLWLLSWIVYTVYAANAVPGQHELHARQNEVDLKTIMDQVDIIIGPSDTQSSNGTFYQDDRPVVVNLTPVYRMGFFEFYKPTFLEERHFYGNLVLCGQAFAQEMISRQTCHHRSKIPARFVDCRNLNTRFYVVNQADSLTYGVVTAMIGATGGFLASSDTAATKFFVDRIDTPGKVVWAGGLTWQFSEAVNATVEGGNGTVFSAGNLNPE
ncbi:uncharacterized protein KY384_001014 [Bacidia gigantensis]|uniref:uncharacterized protein n=1 Tax=Bacidia gigantensis TaxID=2732470 RepID=UPI001D04E404|nr:uncharacterized protein KY384_001014 [Bacidia gigantensis]KAG8534170.1 hypothetical protein KY384_001014 [Bacidia gigantensis]